MIDIFLNTWRNYNVNGIDGGQWITLPMEAEELQEALEAIAESLNETDAEWFVNDYEWTCEIELFEVSENENIETINNRLQGLDKLTEYDQKEMVSAMIGYGYSYEEAFDLQQRGAFHLHEGMSLYDVAYDLAHEIMGDRNVMNFCKTYFDYEAFARDLAIEGYVETPYGVIAEDRV